MLTRRKILSILIMFCLSATFIAACNTTGTGQSQNSKSYGNDGYLGITNANPNLQTSPTYHTYRNDVKVMAATLRTVPGVKDARVTFNGDRAHVKIIVDEGLSPEEARFIENAAYNALLPQVPRYHVKVTSNKNN